MLPFTVGIRDGVVHLVSTLGSAVISARAEGGRRTHWRARSASGRAGAWDICLVPFFQNASAPRSALITKSTGASAQAGGGRKGRRAHTVRSWGSEWRSGVGGGAGEVRILVFFGISPTSTR